VAAKKRAEGVRLVSVSRRLELLLNALVVVMAIVFSALVLFQILARYVFGISIFFASAVSNYVFIWFAMLGAALAMKEGLHVAVDLLPRYVRGKWKVGVTAVALVMSVTFVCILIFASISALPAAQRNVNPALGVSVVWGIAAIPVGCVFIAFFALESLLKLLQGLASEHRAE